MKKDTGCGITLIGLFLASAATSSALIYIAVHFVIKYW